MMPIITSIKPQKTKLRVNIYLDEEFGFGLDLENYVKLGLKVGQELSEEKIIEITKKAEFQKAMDRLLNFTTIRPRSEKEVFDWMKRKNVDESLKSTLTEKLRKLELLNDEKFAGWWVEQRQIFRPKPKRIINNELRIKGIKKEIIDKVLNKTEVDEIKIARNLVEKREYKWKELMGVKKRQKMGRFLAGKGFGWEVIRSVIDRNLKKG